MWWLWDAIKWPQSKVDQISTENQLARDHFRCTERGWMDGDDLIIQKSDKFTLIRDDDWYLDGSEVWNSQRLNRSASVLSVPLIWEVSISTFKVLLSWPSFSKKKQSGSLVVNNWLTPLSAEVLSLTVGRMILIRWWGKSLENLNKRAIWANVS